MLTLNSISQARDTYLEFLHQEKNMHKIWHNPLLIACENAELSFEDCRFLFSQYYYFSKHFTRLLGAALMNSEQDKHRAMLVENLWEESGEQDLENRHSEIYKRFLCNSLQVENVEQIEFEPFTKLFIHEYIALCQKNEADSCAAILAFATEAIVPRLYQVFKKTLLGVGLAENDLLFFNIHIECDDAHAATLEAMAMSYIDQPFSLERCQHAIRQALDLRDQFFSQLYQAMINRRLLKLLQPLVKHSEFADAKAIYQHGNDKLTPLYSNKSESSSLLFSVGRYDYPSHVLDPRLLKIPVGCHNERHAHAHESVFYIAQGQAEVHIDDCVLSASKGEVVYVPRWLEHQTHNIGKEELIIFAITDYKLTRHFSGNSEASYRKAPENVFQDVTV